MRRAMMCIFGPFLLFAFTGQAGADTTIAMETDMQEAGTCSVGDPRCSDEAVHVDAAKGTMLFATRKERGIAKFTKEASASPPLQWDDRARQLEDFINSICGQMKTEVACSRGDGAMFCEWFDACEDEPVCQNVPVLAMGCESGEVSCYHGEDALCPDGLMDQYTCSADNQFMARDGEPSPPLMLLNMTFTSLQDLSPFVSTTLAEEDDEEYFELCDDASDPGCDYCLKDHVFLYHDRCEHLNEAGMGLIELGKGKKTSSQKGGKKQPAKKSSKKGAKKSSPKGKGHAAKKAGKAKTTTASLNHYAASNGKWTIGGLSKPDVFSLITHNGMA